MFVPLVFIPPSIPPPPSPHWSILPHLVSCRVFFVSWLILMSYLACCFVLSSVILCRVGPYLTSYLVLSCLGSCFIVLPQQVCTVVLSHYFFSSFDLSLSLFPCRRLNRGLGHVIFAPLFAAFRYNKQIGVPPHAAPNSIWARR
jgi:hypothetical protein